MDEKCIAIATRILCQICKRTVQMEIGINVQTSPFAWCERVDFWQLSFSAALSSNQFIDAVNHFYSK